MKCPCKECKPPVRYIGCHAACKAYRDWKEFKAAIANLKENRVKGSYPMNNNKRKALWKKMRWR